MGTELESVVRGGAWRLGHGAVLSLERPRIMAILNMTPDSFSDGGSIAGPADAVEAARRAVEDGADMLDIGGESTRPGAAAVSEAEQIARVRPVVEAIRRAGGALGRVPISVDTTRAAVARAALEAGADAVNDVSAGTDDPAMLGLVAQRGCGVVLMHRVAPPARDRYSDGYERPPIEGDVVDVVRAHLATRVRAAMELGIAREAILVDPGLGFGKTVEQNWTLVRRTGEFAGLGAGVLGAASRKSFVGRAMMRDDTAARGGAGEGTPPPPPPPPGERLMGSIACSVVQVLAGARVVRVHDVRAQAEAVRAAWRVGGEDMGEMAKG